MSTEQKDCFGILDTVFPLQPDGLRETPADCMQCPDKTACLRAAINSNDGLTLNKEKVDRAYQSGSIGFLERWSKRKTIKQQQKEKRGSKK